VHVVIQQGSEAEFGFEKLKKHHGTMHMRNTITNQGALCQGKYTNETDT